MGDLAGLAPEGQWVLLEEAVHDRAVDQYATGSVCGSTWAGNPAIFDKAEDLEFLSQARWHATVDGLLGPFTEVQICLLYTSDAADE